MNLPGPEMAVVRPSATVSRIGLMESCTCRHCRGGPPPPPLTPPHRLPSHWLTDPPAWHDNVMDGWGAQPLR